MLRSGFKCLVSYRQQNIHLFILDVGQIHTCFEDEGPQDRKVKLGKLIHNKELFIVIQLKSRHQSSVGQLVLLLYLLQPASYLRVTKQVLPTT